MREEKRREEEEKKEKKVKKEIKQKRQSVIHFESPLPEKRVFEFVVVVVVFFFFFFLFQSHFPSLSLSLSLFFFSLLDMDQVPAFDEFLRTSGVPMLQELHARVARLDAELANYTDLRLWALCPGKADGPTETMVDVGLRTMVPGKPAEAKDGLFVHAGCGVHVWMSREECAAFAAEKIEEIRARRTVVIRTLTALTGTVLSMAGQAEKDRKAAAKMI